MTRILLLAILSIYTPAAGSLSSFIRCDNITPRCASAPVLACGPAEERFIVSRHGAQRCVTETPGWYCYSAYRAATEACGCSWENGVSPQ